MDAIVFIFFIGGALGLFTGFLIGRMFPRDEDMTREYQRGRADQLHNKKDRYK